VSALVVVAAGAGLERVLVLALTFDVAVAAFDALTNFKESELMQ
jgi:hypothetical protein